MTSAAHKRLRLSPRRKAGLTSIAEALSGRTLGVRAAPKDLTEGDPAKPTSASTLTPCFGLSQERSTNEDIDPMSSRSNLNWLMAARDMELSRVREALAARSGALIVGGQGTGKSALLAAALQQAAASGRTILCLGGVGWIGGPGIRGFGSLREFLAEIEPPSPTDRGDVRPVLGIDDAHLLDLSSSLHLHRLVAAGRLDILATASSTAGAAGIEKLWIEQILDRVDILPLDRASIGLALRQRLDGPVDAFTLERFWALTRGRAFIFQELVEHALEERSLHCEDGIWRWTGPESLAGSRLSNVIRLSIRDLNSAEQEVVNMLALAEPLEASIVSDFGLARAAESLDLRGFVTVQNDRSRVTLRLALPLTRMVVLGDMSELTAHRLRREIAEAIQRTGARRQGDVLRIVSLRADSNIKSPVDQVLEAAGIALGRRDFALAERLCRMTLQELWGWDSATLEMRLRSPRFIPDTSEDVNGTRAALLLGQALIGLGCTAQGDRVIEASLSSRAELPAAEYVAAVHARITNMAWGLKKVNEACQLLDHAIDNAESRQTGVLLSARVSLAVMTDRLNDAVALGDKLLSDRSLDLELVQSVVPAVAFAQAELGSPADALELLRSHQESMTDWESNTRVAARSVLARCHALLGELGNAAIILEPIDRWHSVYGQPVFLQALLEKCWVHRTQGRPYLAVKLLREAFSAQASSDSPVTSPWYLAHLASALAEAGEHAESLRTLIEVRTAREEFPLSLSIDDEVAYESALVLAHTGDYTHAAIAAADLAERAGAAGRIVRATMAILLAARVSQGSAVRPSHLDLIGPARAAGGITETFADYIEAVVHQDGAKLLDVAQRLSAIGALPLASEAAAQAMNAFRAAGEYRSRRSAWTVCQDLIAESGLRLPPWMDIGTHVRSGISLTAREREIAALAATGMPNRTIAKRLTVSVRTVENHLHRIYHKLGIATRLDLKKSLDGLLGRS
ncbi:LuxR C-terminal-related transcriptional regulator [Streptomyces sp. NPDC058739]|uniref:LuxR C-terminal-related transcriptional regulator n=1 Tax=Streptomyces sp. NPDC058739 TaxID=3346618 RepID=UPI0036AE0C04